jgi:predicted GNAT family acetyltransferase
MNQNSIQFIQSKSEQDIADVYNFNVDVFAESPELNWTLDALKDHAGKGWKIYSVQVGKDIVAAALMRAEDKRLVTQNTPIKLEFQGNGYSHKIKEFFEAEAKKLKLAQVVSLCSENNFRMISLNETHGYVKTSKRNESNPEVIEWIKSLDK